MGNPRLTAEQREKLFKPLLEKTIRLVNEASQGDPRLFWAIRRKLAKELTYMERGTPMHRKALKAKVWEKQNGICALCSTPMEQKGSELDRYEAFEGYTEENVRLVHHECHLRDQEKKGYV